MISFKDVSYCPHGQGKKKTLLFDKVSFSIGRGERVAVLGNRGVGKSALLNMLAGKIRPDSGDMCINGHMSMPLGQSWGVHPTLTGRQNMRFLIRLRGLEPSMREITEDFENFSELGALFDKPVASYPSALKTRFYQSLFFTIPSDFYICDATLGAGDERFKERAATRLKTSLGGCGIFLAHPNEKIIREFCSVALVISGKKISYFESMDSAYDCLKDGAK